MRVTLYSRPGCHLCEDLKGELAALPPDIDITLLERNIEDEAGDLERYRYLIPVLDIEGGPLLYPPHERNVLLAALRAAGESIL